MERQVALKMFSTFATLCVIYNGVYGRASSEIDMKLKALNKPAVTTIYSEDGDIIDCVDIYKQPVFDHPVLRNHKIQMKPSVELVPKKTNSSIKSVSKSITSQIWTKSGTCPVGTIPIRRVSREDISRASSPSQFGRKTPHVHNSLDKAHQHHANINLTAAKSHNNHPQDRSEAYLLAVGYNYLGATSHINIWNPRGVQDSDYSSGQIWLLAGWSKVFDTIEAGWVVNPGVFGDKRTRLFVYWTRDGYGKTGCFNLLCSGFVHTSTHLALGAILQPVSSSGHDQYYLDISMFLDPTSGNWWVNVGDIVLGYWPKQLFTELSHSATAVQWGGEVYSPNVRKKPHTKTPMGSGEWATGLWGKACYHTNIKVKDYSLQLKYPAIASEYSDEFDCYSTMIYRKSKNTEPYFYFGGPGQNPHCP